MRHPVGDDDDESERHPWGSQILFRPMVLLCQTFVGDGGGVDDCVLGLDPFQKKISP